MVVIGLAGGIASGKSMISGQFQALGARCLDADKAGHQVLLDPDVKSAVRERWGDQVFDPSGEINRAEVASIVFAQNASAREELSFLEQLTHPRIGQLLQQQMDHCEGDVLVLDAPVMFKAGWNQLCNEIVFIEAPHADRLRRALQRGWTAEQFAAREAAQEPLDWKRQQAGFVIDNSSTPDHTRQQVETIWKTITGARVDPSIVTRS